MNFETFISQFSFDPTYKGYVGVEWEVFVTDQAGRVVPSSAQILEALKGNCCADQVGYELSACQVELRTKPVKLAGLKEALVECREALTQASAKVGLQIAYMELAPSDIPLDVYPDPRYLEIKSRLSVETLRAGCRVAGVHVHVGMPDYATALRTYRHVLPYVPHLVMLGDRSEGERMRLYRSMTPESDPPDIQSWEHLYEYACARGWVNDPRSWWSLVRISKHGTIEFRVFGSTDDINQIFNWANLCHKLCHGVM